MVRRNELKEKKKLTPRVCIDYYFGSQEDEEAKTNPFIIMVDETSGEKYSRAVGKKGAGVDGELDWLIKDMSDELRSWGHQGGDAGKIILKCDGEVSIKAIRDAVGKFHGGIVIPEQAAKNESQSNGTVEESVKTVRGYARVLKDQIEYQIDGKISSGAPIMLWLIRWAAMIPSRFLKGKDMKTPYERRRGRKCDIPVVPFGETVWFKRIRDGKTHKDKMESEWEEGIWLGHHRESNEVIVGTSDGVLRAFTVERKPIGERWEKVRMESMKGTPQQPNPSKKSLGIPTKVAFDEPDNEVVREAIPARNPVDVRRMRITDELLKRYGYTE
jgi:hypothetical protein